MNRLEQQMQFALEIDKEKEIYRQTYCSDNKKKENDAEHAWHAALMTILLSEYASEPFDVLKTVTMLLIHDIVEIDAGDTYAYDDVGIVSIFSKQPIIRRLQFQIQIDHISTTFPRDLLCFARNQQENFICCGRICYRLDMRS